MVGTNRTKAGESLWPNHLAALVHRQRVARGLTLEQLAEKAGLGKNREKITTILRGNWPRHATLLKVIHTLDIPLEQVYPLPEYPTTGEVLETMRLRRGLTIDVAGAIVGISGTQLRRIERNLSPNSPSIAHLRAYHGVENIAVYDDRSETPLAAEIDDAIRSRGLTIGAAAREAELDHMTIKMVLRGFRPSLETMKKLEAAFGLPIDLARAFDPASTLAEQLQVRKWRSGLSSAEFSREIGLSESSFTTVVANGVIGDEVQTSLASSALVTEDAVQRAKARYIKRVLDQRGNQVPSRSKLGRYIEEECISQGRLPKDIARALGIHPSLFRRLRRGQIPRYRQTVEKIANALGFTEQQRLGVLEEWTSVRQRPGDVTRAD